MTALLDDTGFDYEGTCSGCRRNSSALNRDNLCRSCVRDGGELFIPPSWDEVVEDCRREGPQPADPTPPRTLH